MKLNVDCVRDLMLWAEVQTTPTRFAIYIDLDTLCKVKDCLFVSNGQIPSPNACQKELLAKYDNETLVYHLRYCIEAELLRQSEKNSECFTIVVEDLTPLGHDFIGNIREARNYSSVKAIAKKTGAETVNALIGIAKQVVLDAITAVIKDLQLNNSSVF